MFDTEGTVFNVGYNDQDSKLEIFAKNGVSATNELNAGLPDIVANSIDIVSESGGIGVLGRPLLISSEGAVFFDAFPAFAPIFFNGEFVTGQFQSAQGLIDQDELFSVGGEELTDIETLEEIDPAVFTAVGNYAFDDISVRLPDDQLYDDDYDEEEE